MKSELKGLTIGDVPVGAKIIMETGLRRIGLACTALTAIVSGVALAGWLTKYLALASVGSEFIPMAPSTAICFLLLSFPLTLLFFPSVRPSARICARLCVGAVSLLCSILLISFIQGTRPELERLLSRREEYVGLAPIGFMSPITAASFIAACAVFVLHAGFRQAAAYTAAVVAATGLVLLLGYLYGTPMLYGGTVIPVALSTAFAIVALGMGLLASCGNDRAPVSFFTGQSVRSRLMRTFLPLVLLAVISTNWVDLVLPLSMLKNPALSSSLIVIVFALVFGSFIAKFSRSIGNSIDAAIAAQTKAGETLRLAGAYNRNLIETSLDLLATIGPDGKITDVNAATENVTGCSRAELVGTDFSDYFTEPEKAQAGYKHVFIEGFVRDYPLEIRNRDGRITPVLYNAAIYRDDSGKVTGVFAAARDVSERKRAEKELLSASLYTRSLIEANLDPLVTIGQDGKITDVNRATEAVTGRARKELLGTDFSDYFTEPELARSGYQKVFREGTVRDYPLEIRHSDGHITPVLYNASVYRDEAGKVAGVFASARDITELKKYREHLEEIVRERTAQLEASNKELEAFAYSVSHDLRAPLRAVDGFSRMLEEDYTQKIDDEGRRILGVVRSETRKMGQLIDDLLSFSRIGRREINMTEIDMETLARAICDELVTLNPGRSIDLRIGSLPSAGGDQAMVRQVLVNLVSNALKFTRPREKAAIEISGRRDSGENVYSIKDNGVGFDMQYVNKLFGVFQRLHSADEFEGTGVGLAVVHRIISRHGGRTWAEGTVGEGATFYFSLPDRSDASPNDDNGHRKSNEKEA